MGRSFLNLFRTKDVRSRQLVFKLIRYSPDVALSIRFFTALINSRLDNQSII